MSFTCPRCGAESHHPKDEEHGYCGRCHDFTGHPTAELQLWFDVRSAADQMVRAKWRDAHPGNELVIPEHADLVIWLLDQLASFRETNHFETTKAGVIDWKMEAERANRLLANCEERHERLDRVDTALAKRVGDMIAHNATVMVKLTDWLKAYPLDIFPEPDLKKAHALLQAGGMTLDVISGHIGRDVLTRVLKIIDADCE